MPYTSAYPALDIPNDVDLWSLLFERNDLNFPQTKELIVDGETGKRSYTWAGLRDASIAFGKGLKDLWGFRKGHVLAMYTPNSIDTPVVTLGAIWAGGIVTPANPLYTAEELAFQLKDSNAKGLVTQLPYLKTALEAAKRVGIPEDRIILLGDARDPQRKFKHFSQIISTNFPNRFKKAKINPQNDLVFLVYSSGTTGLPKGVCLTHHNLVANMLQMFAIEGRFVHPTGGPGGEGDKQLAVLPFFHIYGLTCILLMAIYSGCQLVVLERFDMEKVLKAIQNYRITMFYVPPPIVLAFSKHPLVDKYDLTSLKAFHSGAAPLTRELTEALWDRLKIPVKQGYGLSETAPVVTVQTIDEWAKFMGSAGKVVPNMEFRIVDEEGKDVPDGKSGELWVKGPNVFKGYLNNPERTKEAFSEDGYFKTGDVFVRDKYGNMYCVDRLKELIKYKGFPVPPAELEGLLVGHKDVADACVIGVDDKEQATEVPRAYVVLRPGVQANEATAKALADFVASQVAPHKKIRGGIRFVDQVPKSASGKILRRLMKEQAKKEDRAAGSKL